MKISSFPKTSIKFASNRDTFCDLKKLGGKRGEKDGGMRSDADTSSQNHM